MSTDDQEKSNIHLDAVVVGAGFSGIASLYRLRKAGLKVKAFEAGSDFGGVWYWNRYPGARVDSEYPLYQLNIPEVHSTWDWSVKFPAQKELVGYFNHVDKVLGLRKDVYFNAEVTSVQYNNTHGWWTVKSAQRTATCKYLVLAAGALHRTYRPDFPGLDDFKGDVYHTASWPEDSNLQGKKVAVIGAGATGVQVVQELAKQVDQLFVCVRNPSYCLPMGQRKVSTEEQGAEKAKLQETLQKCRDTLAGYPLGPTPGSVFDRTPEDREAHWEAIYGAGGFSFLQANYSDMLVNPKANREIYNFWARKTRARVTDPVKRDIIAPLEPPYPFGTRRTPLDQDYYECLNQPNVNIVSLRNTPIAQFNKTGFVTTDGTQRDFDALVLATGFDSFTGSLTTMGLRTKDGIDMKEYWRNGVSTYLGIFVNGLPNAFLLYSPQAPTSLSNGPTLIECQADLMMDTIRGLESINAKSIEPKESAETEWKDLLERMIQPTLFQDAGSWWNGANIPGKKKQVFNYIGGLSTYEKTCRDSIATWKGFNVTLHDKAVVNDHMTIAGARAEEVDLIEPVTA